MKKIRVLIADDHELIRSCVRKALEEQPDMEVVEEAGDGLETVEKVIDLRPDIALIDIAMPKINGLEAMRRIRKSGCKTRVVMLSIHRKDAYVYQAIVSGALGYVLKPSLTPNLIEAVRAAFRGEYFLNPKINSHVIQDAIQVRSENERRIEQNAEILTENSISTHRVEG